MSQRNVELVQGIYENFPAIQDRLREGDFPIGWPFAEDVDWDASAMGLPDLGDGHMRGREGVRRFWVAWLSAWQDVSMEWELRSVGEHVVALIDQRMQGSKEIELLTGRYAQVWTFNEGQVVGWKVYRTQEEALEAVGLRE